MRQVTRKGLMTVAAATGVLAVTGGYAHADSGAHGTTSGSPGVLSGNSVQAPVHAPVNVCGNTVNVVGALNPAAGNECADEGGDSGQYGPDDGAQAGGHTEGSPGVGSGNHVQIPVDVPVDVCGNSVSAGGVGNTAADNACGHSGGADGVTPPGHGNPDTPGTPDSPGRPDTPGGPGDQDRPGAPGDPGKPGGNDGGGSGGDGGGGGATDGSYANHPGTRTADRPDGSGHLAQTGGDVPLGLALPVSAGALLAGTVLYRRARASA
ncbi:chaplin [Streptomyces beigongshangae]|uniref:chaplin n=1 Tax=Streptomyces beigongshangae TaxID=2841597 RepID=UPI001C84916D|nr:chaplin family protein [Streptomyces sp. REN17]